MSKGNSGLFAGTQSTTANSESAFSSVGEMGYNDCGSKSVQKVDSVSTTIDLHSVPTHGIPNSVSKNYKDGKLDSERYYDEAGKAYLDIDYTNHGNPKIHPNVPHEHSIYFDENGNMIRGKEPKGGINK